MKSRCEKLFVVIALLCFTGPVIPLAVRHGALSFGASVIDVSKDVQDNSVLNIFLIVIVAITLFILGPRQSFSWSLKDKLLFLILILAFLSLFWSDDPGMTARRVVGLLGTVMMGIYLAARYTFDEIMELLAWSLGAAAVMSVIAAVALPDYGVMSGMYAGAWRGIYLHKNMLARKMALGAVSFLLIALGRRQHRFWGIAGFCLLLLVVIRSGSVSSLLVLLMLLISIPAFNAMRRHPVMVVTLIVCVVAFTSVSIAVSSGFGPLAKALGRDSTLTGRVDLWESAVLVIQKAPWLGHGYGTGWAGDEPWTGISRFSTWNAPHAHNGFLTLALDLGFVGLALFGISYFVALRRAFTFLRDQDFIRHVWPLMFLAFLFFSNLTESVLFKYDTIECVLYVATVLSLANATRSPEMRNEASLAS